MRTPWPARCSSARSAVRTASGRRPFRSPPSAPGQHDAVYYGLRAWGPNWVFDPAWQPGSEAGFRDDVDAAGNRFNPNKLLIDPYAVELSHDPEPRLSVVDPNEPSRRLRHRSRSSGRRHRSARPEERPAAALTGGGRHRRQAPASAA